MAKRPSETITGPQGKCKIIQKKNGTWTVFAVKGTGFGSFRVLTGGLSKNDAKDYAKHYVNPQVN